ncbi:hypothetical protein R5R35_012682 [Gryllus longicercus]|uniref:Ionotropic receptor n=1 Tax=Gryllus longicercus TaxID=2509291 RepID=A0AAN9Z5R1_9ORTH
MVSRFKNASCLQVPFSQLTQSLLNGTAHVSGNAWWQKPGSPAGYLYPHRLDDLCVVVKRRRRVQQSILQSFSADTWTATGASLAAFAGALRLIGRRNVFLEVVDAFINGGFVARKSDRRANLLLLLLSAFGLVMVSAFTGRFMGFLAVLGEPHQMQTLVDVARYASRVYGLEYIPLLLKDVEKNDVVWKLVAKFQTTKAEEAKATMLRDFSSEETSTAYIISMSQARVFLEGNLWDASSGTTLGYQVPQCLLSPGYRSFMTQPHWAYKQKFDTLLQGIVEAGIYLKIKSDVWFTYRAKALVRLGPALPSSASHAPASEEPKPLGLSALVEPAAVLGVGALAATIGFAVEVLMGTLVSSV